MFERIAVVGLGVIGGSIALAARERFPAGLVIGVDDNAVLERAMSLHAIDVAADDLVVASDADLVILAAPVKENLRVLERLPECVPGSAVVTDTGSTKRVTIEAARHLPDRLAFVGGHPLGGAARSGIEHARPDLFKGRPWILTADVVGNATEQAGARARVSRLVTEIGAVPRVMDAATHDHLVAFISQLPQLAVSALMHVVGETVDRDGLALAGRGLLDTTRLASSPGSVWRDICATNADEIGPALDALVLQLTRLRQNLHASSEIEELFQSGNVWRDRLVEQVER